MTRSRRRATPSRALPLLLAATALAAPAARAETLADAMRDAYAHDPTVVQQRFLQKGRDESYVQARSGYGPQLNIETDAYHEYQSQFGISATSNQGRAVASLSQPLYTSGRLRGQVAAARADVLSGQQQLRTTEQQTVQNVVIVYAAVLRDESRVQVGRENVAVLRDQLRQNQERRRVQDVTLTDVGQADSRLAAAEITLASLEQSLATSRANYLEVVGHNPGTLTPLPDDLGGLPVSIDEAFAAAEESSPALLAAKYTEQSSSASVAAAKGALGPTVSLSAQGTYQNTLLHIHGQDASKDVTAGVTVTQNLFAAGANRSRVRQAEAQNNADQVAIDGARRAALDAVTTAWSQLAATRVALTAGERQVASAQLAFAGMRREELYGLRSTIDTLNAEQELVNAQLEFLQNRYQLYVSHVAVLAAMGTLDARRLAPGIQLYDPEQNFRRVRFSGATPFEAVAAGVDRIGSASPRRPLSADLTGANVSSPEHEAALPPQPSPATLNAPLVPVTQSPLVPASALPGGMPGGDHMAERLPPQLPLGSLDAAPATPDPLPKRTPSGTESSIGRLRGEDGREIPH